MARKLRRVQWSRPMLVAVFLAAMVPLQVGVGLWARGSLDRSLENHVRDELTTILDADVTALRLWLKTQEQAAVVVSAEPTARRLVARLDRLARSGAAREALLASNELRELREYVQPIMSSYQMIGFGVLDRNGRILAALDDRLVGTRMAGELSDFIATVQAGNTLVSRPVPPTASSGDGQDGAGPSEPAMFAAAPVHDENGDIIAALGFRISSVSGFTRILNVARSGATGETYAFDSNGVLISDSRFYEDLRAIGLIPDDPDSRPILQVEIRDPGGNMVEGFVPSLPLRARPLTRMAADAIQGNSGVDVGGYRDYRGVPVVGAWTWLPEYGFGVATEIDVAEAYGTLESLRTAFWVLIGLLAISALGIALSYWILRVMRRSVRRAEKLGQYTLDKKIGQGGMGSVYTAHHAMLRRPTAIKLLRPDTQTAESIARFEREVQLTSRLTHPNTIAIYDYGRTPDDVFYYAMEYLPGITLDLLVASDGPQPESRVIHILRQACGSLAEAHSAGIVHRDIKPSNIMLCERGGTFDFVKLLDFGLVKPIDESSDMALTAVNAVAGTPHYLSPEGISDPDQVDGRSDIYCLGAVAYFLLTGRHVFEGQSVIEVFGQHLNTQPKPPSSRLGRQISKDLEDIILRCLAKDMTLRPQDALLLREELDACVDSDGWGEAEAYAWWADHSALAETPLAESEVSSSSGRLAEAVAVALQDRLSSDAG